MIRLGLKMTGVRRRKSELAPKPLRSVLALFLFHLDRSYFGEAGLSAA
jgi:hypothetical protein